MSFLLCFGIPLLGGVYCLACARWAWKRCLHTGRHDSEAWGTATSDEFEPVPRLCRMIVANYEDDIGNPLCNPPGGYGMDPSCLVRRKVYGDTKGRCTPCLIYIDHANHDIVLAIRVLHLAKESDYAVLLDNRLGKKKYDNGYVHNGLLKAAAWLLDEESGFLRELLEKYPEYTLTFAGHSLGSGVAAMLTMLVVQNRESLGIAERKRVRGFAIAPARCMSLNLAVKYADVINSIIIQDDFLPRTATSLEDIFKFLFCLPCLLCFRCTMDTCVPEELMFRDPRRLYAPGRLYHIVERKPFSQIGSACGWKIMLEKERPGEVPPMQKMQRQTTLAMEHTEEHKAALRRAVTLAVPDAFSPPTYGTFTDSTSESGEGSSSSRKKGHETWKQLVDRLFENDESGKIVLHRPAIS